MRPNLRAMMRPNLRAMMRRNSAHDKLDSKVAEPYSLNRGGMRHAHPRWECGGSEESSYFFPC